MAWAKDLAGPSKAGRVHLEGSSGIWEGEGKRRRRRRARLAEARRESEGMEDEEGMGWKIQEGIELDGHMGPAVQDILSQRAHREEGLRAGN